MGHGAKAGAVQIIPKSPTDHSRSFWMVPLLVKDQHEKAGKMAGLKRCNWTYIGRGKGNSHWFNVQTSF